MQPIGEIARIHDLFNSLIERFDGSISDEDMVPFQCSLGGLCWVLQHDHNRRFTKNIAEVYRELERVGVVLNTIKSNTP